MQNPQRQSSIPLVVTPTSQFDHSTGKMMHFVKDDNNSPSPAYEFHQTPASTFGEPIVHEIPVVLEVTGPQASQATPTDAPEASEVPASQSQVPPQVSVEGSSIISSSLVSNNNLSQ
ncbi:hypothetical protein C1H46_005505 [Malus baccata]|uniref:Uncharacterized protein n=1 Tax=Malus baccata TaxID=106549 RepID=A0A540NCX6_MALBA|nr:hypothetical protein C1H46_005505 [Malus baccata]